MRDPANLEKVCGLGPDMVGFIFYPGSKRYVGPRPDPALFTIPGKKIRKVGVFVNEHPETVQRLAGLCRLDLVQLHGSEPLSDCRFLQRGGTGVIKALHAGEPAGGYESPSLKGAVQYLLFDTPGEGFGGTGEKFDWGLLNGMVVRMPFLIGGGIGPADAGELKRIRNEQWTGVDLNSRFETEPGLKDVGLLDKFINEIRKL